MRIVAPQFHRLDLPISFPEVFAQLLALPYPVFLDGALGFSGSGRYSYATADPFLTLRSKGRQVEVETEGVVSRVDSNPFTVLQDLLKRYVLSAAPGRRACLRFRAEPLAIWPTNWVGSWKDCQPAPSTISIFRTWTSASTTGSLPGTMPRT